MSSGHSYDKFLKLLVNQYAWPDYYNFKFITTEEKKSDLITFFNSEQYLEKQSQTGKYISISFRKFVHTPQEVIDIYGEVSKIEGIMML